MPQQSPLSTTVNIKPLLKDGLTLEDIKLRNERNKETETLFNQFYSLLNDNDIKGIRKFLRRNDEMHSLNIRELNDDYPIDEPKFVKQNGILTFIHHSHYHPTLDKLNNEIPYEIYNSVSIDEFQNLINEFNKLYEKVENIYDFFKQVQIFIANYFVNN